MNSPPMSVTAQRGMLSKKPQLSTAVNDLLGQTQSVGPNQSPPRS